MPFESEAQRRWMYANHPGMAKEWEAHTSKDEKLPKRKKRKRNRRRRSRSKSLALALWANEVQRNCLLECDGDIDAALAAAEYIVSTQDMPEDFSVSLATDANSTTPAVPEATKKGRSTESGEPLNEHEQTAQLSAHKTADHFGIPRTDIKFYRLPEHKTFGEHSGNISNLVNVHEGRPINRQINFPLDRNVTEGEHLAAHETAHRAYSHDSELGHEAMENLKTVKAQYGRGVSMYGALSGDHENLMELGAVYSHSPEALKRYSQHMYDIAHNWATQLRAKSNKAGTAALATDIHGHKHLGKGTQKEVTSTGTPAKGGEFAKQSTPDTNDVDAAKQQKQQPTQQAPPSVEQFEHPDSPAWTLPVEHAAVKLADGTNHYIAGDHPGQVTIPNEHRHLLKDAVFTHNHPKGTNALSVADVLTAVATDMAEIRAIAVNNGKKYVVSLKRPKGGWNPHIATEYKQAQQKTLREVQYSSTMHQQITDRNSLELGLLATKYGATYERKEL